MTPLERLLLRILAAAPERSLDRATAATVALRDDGGIGVEPAAWEAAYAAAGAARGGIPWALLTRARIELDDTYPGALEDYRRLLAAHRAEREDTR